MSVRRIRNHGKWVWQARVAFQGLRKAAFRATHEEALDAESELLCELKAQVAHAEEQAQRPATLRQLLEFYALDMQARGKGEESVGRVAYTIKVIEGLMPELLGKPVSESPRVRRERSAHPPFGGTRPCAHPRGRAERSTGVRPGRQAHV